MSTPVSISSMQESRPETISGMAISLAFWLCLLLAANLFAVVALSPKLIVYLDLRSRFDVNQLRLVALENQAGQLQRVVEAIRGDKDFASELTRIEFDALRPDEEVIPVEVALKLDARAFETPLPNLDVVHTWYEPGVKYLAGDASLRTWLLGAAALLVVVSFTMLQPAGAKQVSSGVRNCNVIWRSLRNRYVR